LASKAERIRRLHAGDALLYGSGAGSSVELPLPQVHAVSEWPVRAAAWLYKAGLGAHEIGRLGAYYHPPSDRVVLPLLDPSTGRPVFWQARAVDNRQPKYMAPPVDKAKVLARWGKAAVPTLTEDILSAFKVGLVAEGWAVLGTTVQSGMVAELLRRGGQCNVWLDPDAAGRRGAAKIIKQLSAYGVRCRNIVSPKDPKLHNRREIGEYLA
jgi:DNA primase